MSRLPTSEDIAACTSVLLDLSVIFREFWDACVLIGGWVPYFVLSRSGAGETTVEHVGSLDLDLLVNVDKVGTDGYSAAAQVMRSQDYEPGDNVFERIKVVGPPVTRRERRVRVHLLAPEQSRRGESQRRRMQGGLQLQVISDSDIALSHWFSHELVGRLPSGERHRSMVRVADEVACFVMKGTIFPRRDHYGDKDKDGYDLFMLLRSYDGGPIAFAERVRELLHLGSVRRALLNVRANFEKPEGLGSVWTVKYLAGARGAQSEQEIRETQNEVAYVFGRFLNALPC